jgi:hypothetical protein
MSMTDHDPDSIIARVLGRYLDRHPPEKARRPRTVLVLGRGLAALEPALREAHFRVAVPTSLEDRAIREAYLGNNILVTKNAAAFLNDAQALDFGIVGLDALPVVDTSPKWNDNATAQMILDGVCKFNLHHERGAWVLMLHPGGEHVFMRLD